MGGCCGPSTCCTCDEYPKNKDSCMCGCGYLNGMWALFTSQFFLFVGGVLSLATLGDCSFASIDRTMTLDLSGENGSSFSKDVRGVGFITFEMIDGHCYWYGENYNTNQLDRYWNKLGSEWQVGMALTWFCSVFAWYYFLYTLSFCCSAQVRCCRYLNGFCLSVLLVIAQGCTFTAYNSPFCEEYDCSFSRTAGYSIGAIVCYSIAGMGFFATSDYPGQNMSKDVVQDVTNAVVYHPDPELTATEYVEAKRISQQLGGTRVSVTGNNMPTSTILGGEVEVGDDIEQPNETSMNRAGVGDAEPLERSISVVEKDNHPAVAAQY